MSMPKMTDELIRYLYPSVPEKRFQAQIKELALLLGWKYYHTWSSVHSPAGFPDCVFVKPPRLIFAELKTGKQYPTDHQKHWLNILSKIPGVEVYCWRPSEWDEIVAILKKGDQPDEYLLQG